MQRGAVGVSVDSSGTMQPLPYGWDEGVMREGDTIANDAIAEPLAPLIDPC